MRAEKRKKKSIFLRIAIVTFSIYVVIMLVQLQLEVNACNERISNLDDAILQQTIENEDLQKQSDDYESWLEKKAYEQGYARPGETIYKEDPGN